MASHRWNNFWIPFSNWEYWPAWLFNIPVVFMWLRQALRCRNLFFFSVANPDIKTGGFFSEEKWPIYEMFPEEYIPKGVLIRRKDSLDSVCSQLKKKELKFPVLAKPNIGERGMGIERIKSNHELKNYHDAANFDYIIQRFISYPLEMSVLAYRMPNSQHVAVTSVCLKEKLTIRGDGRSSVVELVNKQYRSRKHWPRLRKYFDEQNILKKGEQLLLEPIGNHSRGTTFLDGNDLITPRFNEAIQKLFQSINGEVYYGRFDIIYESIEALIDLKQFKVVEFNGVGSEPAHIYQPGFSIFKAYHCIWKHVKIIGDIAIVQQQNGVRRLTWNEFNKAIRIYRYNMKMINRSEK